MTKEALGQIGGIAGVVIAFVLVALISWAVIRGRALLLRHARAKLEGILVQFGATPEHREGYVSIRFPAYVGAVVTVTELATSVWVPRGRARPLINSLALFSLKFGLVTIFAPYVLFMVILNYVLHIPKLAANTAAP